MYLLRIEYAGRVYYATTDDYGMLVMLWSAAKQRYTRGALIEGWQGDACIIPNGAQLHTLPE